MDRVVAGAVDDARTLADAGFPALMVENFGDAPFHADEVPPETIAAMTRAVGSVVTEVGLPTGVNVLRNDALAAVGVAAAVGAPFIRVNVLTGVMYTDQGPIVGRAAAVQRKRAALSPDLEVWADVLVKHATPPPGTDPTQAALDTVERGLADAVIVSGAGTGSEPDLARLAAVRKALPDGTRVVIGSGAGPENLSLLLEHADTVIVGSSLKPGGDPSQPVDPARARAFAEEAARQGLV